MSVTQNRARKKNRDEDLPYHGSATSARIIVSDRERERERLAERERLIKSSKPEGNLIDFHKLPPDAVMRYLTHFDLLPSLNLSEINAVNPVDPENLIMFGGRRGMLHDDLEYHAVQADLDRYADILAEVAQQHFNNDYMAMLTPRDEFEITNGFVHTLDRLKSLDK